MLYVRVSAKYCPGLLVITLRIEYWLSASIITNGATPGLTVLTSYSIQILGNHAFDREYAVDQTQTKAIAC